MPVIVTPEILSLPSSLGSGTLTRKALRRIVSRTFNASSYLLGTVAASPAPTTSLVAAHQFIDSRVDNSFYVGSHVWVPEVMEVGDTVDRIVATYTSATGAMVPHRPFAIAPPVGGEVELHAISVDLIHRAINRGLERCEFDVIAELPASSSNAQTYSLSSLSQYIKGRRNILGVYPTFPGTFDSDILPQEFEWWDMQYDGTDWVLRIGTPVWSTSVIWVHLIIGYPPLSIDDEGTGCPEEWAVAATLVELYQSLMDATGTNRESSVYTTNRARWMATFRHLSQLYGVKRHDKLNYSVPEWGPIWGQGLRRRGVI